MLYLPQMLHHPCLESEASTLWRQDIPFHRTLGTLISAGQGREGGESRDAWLQPSTPTSAPDFLNGKNFVNK